MRLDGVGIELNPAQLRLQHIENRRQPLAVGIGADVEVLAGDAQALLHGFDLRTAVHQRRPSVHLVAHDIVVELRGVPFALPLYGTGDARRAAAFAPVEYRQREFHERRAVHRRSARAVGIIGLPRSPDADAQLRFTATRTRSWSDNKYDYTETNYYSVRRDGTLGFDAVPVDGSSKIEDDLMESIEPFAMQDAIPFQTAYLAGYVADKYDVNAEDSIERANKRIRRSTEETFQQTVTGYDSVKVESSSIQLHGGKAKYALFPVWLLSTSWRGENYLFAMNGQSGKFVGDLPVDKGAARKWMLGLTAALSAASYGVMWLLWLARIL